MAMVTGDAVVLELPPAGVFLRLLSGAIDVAAVLALAFALDLATSVVQLGLDPAAEAAVGLATGVLLLVVLPTTVESLSRGRSVGKLAVGLRVVRDDGGPIRSRQALVRSLVAMIELWGTLGVVAFFAAVGNSRGKRLGDMLAGTYVINERTPLRTGPRAVMPAELAQWAAHADIGRVPVPLSLAARAWLARRAAMTTPSDIQMGRGLARELAAHVSPQPPPGTPPDRFVSAVLAERRTRDARRLAREQAYLERVRALSQARRGRV